MATDPSHSPGNAEVQRLRAVLAALRHVPRDRARALPAAFYTSRDYLDYERDTLFRTQWICLGHIGAIPNVGDYFTAELA